MPEPPAFPLIAVDVGNNRTKFGWFDVESDDRLPQPVRSLQIDDHEPELERLSRWFEDRPEEPLSWWIGSVNRPTCTRLVDWLQEHRPDDRATLLAAGDLPLEVTLERPDMVGIDRLLDAVAANGLREPSQPAVVVDVGSAITVDLLSPDGAFLGGAILPGIAMSARALHEFTDLLPRIEMAELNVPPPALGTATVAAMRSGLFWGAVGAIRQLTEKLAENASGQPQIFLTGGAGPAVAQLLGQRAKHVPHLTLAGIVLAALSAR
jgi:type III pantothenate kinase